MDLNKEYGIDIVMSSRIAYIIKNLDRFVFVTKKKT